MMYGSGTYATCGSRLQECDLSVARVTPLALYDVCVNHVTPLTPHSSSLEKLYIEIVRSRTVMILITVKSINNRRFCSKLQQEAVLLVHC